MATKVAFAALAALRRTFTAPHGGNSPKGAIACFSFDVEQQAIGGFAELPIRSALSFPNSPFTGSSVGPWKVAAITWLQVQGRNDVVAKLCLACLLGILVSLVRRSRTRLCVAMSWKSF